MPSEHPDTDIQAVEAKIETLITKTNGGENVYEILKLIQWDSNIILNVPCIPPYQSDYINVSVTSSYGLRLHPITREVKHHSGIDIPMSLRDTVYSSAIGIVKKCSYDSALGNYVKMSHMYGFETIYGHLEKALVNVGDTVYIGKPIGLAGASGMATGVHLHYSVKKNGKYENPYQYCTLLYRVISNKKGDH